MGGSNSFRVDPQHVKALRDDLQGVSDDITNFLDDKSHAMRVPANALDPVSQQAAQDFGTNADQAIQQAYAFAKNLGDVARSLDGAAKAYTTNDQDGQTTFQSRS